MAFILLLSGAGRAVPQDGGEAPAEDAQAEGLRIGLVLFETSRDEPALQSLCQTATDSLELTLRLLSRYRVYRADFLTPELDLERAELYFRREGFDRAVFGNLRREPGGSLVFTIEAWERARGVTLERSRSADSVFGVFGIVDELTVEFAEEFTGTHLAFGTLRLANDGAEGGYQVYVDGNYLGSNLTERQILAGERTVTVARAGRLGDVIVRTEKVRVEEGGEAVVRFSLPPETAAARSGAEPRTETGNVSIASTPAGAEVYLDQELLGSTPLSLFGVAAGLYELTLRRPYYVPAEKVLRVEPARDNAVEVALALDEKDPAVRAELRDPWGTELTDLGLTAAQYVTLVISAVSQNGVPNPVALALVAPKFGSLLSGNAVLGAGLSTGALVLGLAGSYAFLDSSLIPDASLRNLLYGLQMVLQVVLSAVDLVVTPLAAGGHNRRLLQRYSREAFRGPADGEGEKTFRLVAQLGGGAAVQAGVSLSLFSGRVLLEQLAGAGLSPAGRLWPPILQTTSRALWQPFAARLKVMRPYLGALLNLGTDFSSGRAFGGLAAGLALRLGPLSLYLEAEQLFSASGNPATLAAGIRL